ncbi:MAG: glycoside hydrolase family 3 N-terminal domain-containing protein [Bacteroidota bacterium]
MKSIFLKSLALLMFCSSGIIALGQAKDSLDTMIGQMIMAGVRDYANSAIRTELFEDLGSGKVGGVILFEKNVVPQNSKQELSEMILKLQQKSMRSLLVAIDEEGGKVNRLKPKYGFHKPPSAQFLGKMDNYDSTAYFSKLNARNLQNLGINVNFAPCVDVAVNPNNPIIAGKERSFSSDFRKVAYHAAAYIRGHDEVGVATSLKHFPGHGSSKNDTHLGVADVSDTWLVEEIYPYQMLLDSGLVKAVMTSHVVNRSLDESKKPGTLSPKIVNGLLRGHLGFDGVVFTDDMQMKAITDHYGVENSVKLAIEAGVDVLVFANNVVDHEVVTVRQVHAIIKQMVADKVISRARIEQSYGRIMKMKWELGLLEPNYVKNLERRLKELY